MSGSVEIVLWLHEYELKALEKQLASNGTDVEKRMQKMLADLYSECVPFEERQAIQERINAEHAEAVADQMANTTWAAYHITGHGEDLYFKTSKADTLLVAAKRLRTYLTAEDNPQPVSFAAVLKDRTEITQAEYDQLLDQRLQNTGKVSGVFEMDFDRDTFSAANAMDGWHTYRTLVLLGDVGANYYRNRRDTEMKKVLTAVKPTMLCIHGNHEIRPASLPSYRTKQWNGGTVWVEEAFPRLLFAMDGEIFNLEGLRHLVIGGAYSVDKFYRLARGYGWWPDEQPFQKIKDKVVQTLDTCGWQVDTVLSHTCPYPYEPREAFLPMIDQSTVDDSTEKWLEEIERKLKYGHWFCGHWHIDKHIDRMHFLFHSVEAAPQLLTGGDTL